MCDFPIVSGVNQRDRTRLTAITLIAKGDDNGDGLTLNTACDCRYLGNRYVMS